MRREFAVGAVSLVVLRRCEDVVYLARRRLASAFSLPLVAAAASSQAVC